MVDPSEYESYQSEYLLYYSFLRSKGWKRENRKWVSPNGMYKFTHIHAAYRCAKFYDEIVQRDYI